jgi:hypothetical protein
MDEEHELNIKFYNDPLLKKTILIHIRHPETYWLNTLVELTPFMAVRNENKDLYMY